MSGHYIDAHCPFCNGIGRNDDYSVCLNCKGSGIVQQWWEPPKPLSAERIAELKKEAEKEKAKSIKNEKMRKWWNASFILFVLILVIEIVGIFKFDWKWKWVGYTIVTYFAFGLLASIIDD